MEMKEHLENNQKNLEIANKKALELYNHTKEVKEIMYDLKPTMLKKDNYVLKQEDIDKLSTFLDLISKTNEEYKNIQELSVTLNNVDTEIKGNHKKLKHLLKTMKHLL